MCKPPGGKPREKKCFLLNQRGISVAGSEVALAGFISAGSEYVLAGFISAGSEVALAGFISAGSEYVLAGRSFQPGGEAAVDGGAKICGGSEGEASAEEDGNAGAVPGSGSKTGATVCSAKIDSSISSAGISGEGGSAMASGATGAAGTAGTSRTVGTAGTTEIVGCSGDGQAGSQPPIPGTGATGPGKPRRGAGTVCGSSAGASRSVAAVAGGGGTGSSFSGGVQ